ncbi:SagB/ThcOx family dehydrogenase [Haloarcula onubensis]|uniref:SagB/ThcOx family dehydrogenase n=1 Tax=Haloarcula onubensis TaxID=2950539 RepID=A0ABU2FMH2_9EURY|nr:SagB/ThcOx family dehydrogenase [Halomicroarcula sp. S3CR25-11]MDS0281437.1 SagB/ThcOx family dehydrogenase [Halomicroarcula sp. S3CR25-11]
MRRHTEGLLPLYRLYHRNQYDLVDPAVTVDGDRDWPTGEYREFTRLPAETPSESFDPDDSAFLRRLRSRSSFDDATEPRPVSRDELFAVLASAYRVTPETGTRPVASAGQLYPLELYPLVLDAVDIDAGLYHYNPAANTLERPADPDYVADRFGPLDRFVADEWTHLGADHGVSVMLLVAGLPSRSTVKYGERGYLFTLVEAGAVIHAVQLAAGHLGIGSRPYAGFRYDAVDELLGLADESDEWALVSVALAGP